MLDNLNELIELNLKLLNESVNHKMYKQSFKSFDNKKHLDKDWLASILQEKDLITLKGDNCLLTETGKSIFEKGGWLKKLELDNKNKEAELKKSELKDQLEIELKVLQKESLEYQKTIREQNDRIRNLEEQIKFISLLKLYWWLIPICITIGIFVKEFWDIVKP